VSQVVSKSSLLFAGQIVSSIVAIVTTRYTALGLGPDEYGLYALVFVTLAYSSVLDVGLNFALVKQVAEHDVHRERGRIEALLGAATVVYAAVTALLVAALVLARPWIVRHVFNVPPELAARAETALLVLACAIPFASLSTIFNALLRGLMRFEYVSVLSTVSNCVFSIGAAVLVHRGGRIPAVVALYAAVTVAGAAMSWLMARRALPGLTIPVRARWTDVRRLLAFGRFMALNQVSATVLQQLDKVLVGRLLSVGMLGYYTVPCSVSQRLNALGAAVANVAFPFSSARLARGEHDEFHRGYFQAARLLAWITMGPALVVVVYADDILRLWLDDAFAAHGASVLRLMAVAMWAIAIASLDAVSIEGSGRPWVTSVFMAAAGVVNVVGLLVLVPRFGITGAAMASATAHILLACLDIVFCNLAVLGLGLGTWLRRVGAPSAATAAVSLPLLLLARGLIVDVASLLVVAALATAATLAIGYTVFLAAHERRSVQTRVKALWSPT
jgi:O-antigen/teichoic acid export membrane protein